MPHASMEGQVVVITGATAGVGRATAHRFARAGARLGLIARDQQALDAVKQEVESFGGKVLPVAADVADAQAVFAAAQRIEDELGPIEVWINDAMLTVFAPLSEITPQEFHRVTEVTYLGYVYGTMAALKHMRTRDRGTIVQVGSALAYRGIPLQAAYCGAKHAIRGFTDSLRSELIHENSNIALTMVQLPAVNTPQFDWARTHLDREPRPVPPVVQPEVIARGIFEAVRKGGREYWIGFSTMKVIFGSMLMPGFLDRYLARNAFDAQETDKPVKPSRKDNLATPVHAIHRTRGSFGDEAASHAPMLSGSDARLAVAGLGLGAVLAGLGLVTALGRPSRRSRRRL